jgi:uncharacterized membrane protein HdeD (DUF308 family)
MPASTFLILRGAVGLAIGLIAMAWPGITLLALAGIFGLYAFLDGVTNLLLTVNRARRHERWWAHAIQGLIGVAAGVLTVLWPSATVLALVMFIAAWAIVTGALELVAAIRLRKEIHGEWLLALSGVMSIVFGSVIFAVPGAGAVGVAMILGMYAAASGIVLITLGVRMRTQLVAV